MLNCWLCDGAQTSTTIIQPVFATKQDSHSVRIIMHVWLQTIIQKIWHTGVCIWSDSHNINPTDSRNKEYWSSCNSKRLDWKTLDPCIHVDTSGQNPSAPTPPLDLWRDHVCCHVHKTVQEQPKEERKVSTWPLNAPGPNLIGLHNSCIVAIKGFT